MRPRLFDTLRRIRDGARPSAPAPAISAPEGPRDHVRRVLSRIEADDLDGALAASITGTEAFPAYAELWFLRFDLHLHVEDLDAGRETLRHIARHDPLNQPGAEICLEILEADVQRRRALAALEAPGITGPRTPALELALSSIQALSRGDHAAAGAAVVEARSLAPTLSGRADDAPFRGLHDVDDPLAPVLELLAPGRYQWIALSAISWIEVLPLRTLLDFAWVPVHVELRDGTELRGHVPGLYAGSGAHPEDRVRLGHETAWARLSPALSRASGQRRWQTEGRLIDIRALRVLSLN